MRRDSLTWAFLENRRFLQQDGELQRWRLMIFAAEKAPTFESLICQDERIL